MKFKPYRMSRLNEALLGNNNMDVEVDDEVVGTASVVYADAIKQHKAIEKKLENDFKQVIADTKEFVDDNHNREKKGSTTMEMKKMHLSEGLFEDVKVESPAVDDEEIVVTTTETSTEELTEAIDFGDPLDMGRGACTPLALDYTKAIESYATHMDDPREARYVASSLTNFKEAIEDRLEEVENFNRYWTARYPAMLELMNAQIERIDSVLGAEGVTEAVAVEEPSTKKRTRGENEKKERRDYSSEDLWLAVYDELSATTDNEGAGQQVDKQIKARRGDRYEHVYPHGDSDIIIYATKPEEFEFARQVADHYGVVAEEPKEDKNKTTNGFYKYSMVIRIPEDQLYDDGSDDEI